MLTMDEAEQDTIVVWMSNNLLAGSHSEKDESRPREDRRIGIFMGQGHDGLSERVLFRRIW